jgi:hypothetical protein
LGLFRGVRGVGGVPCWVFEDISLDDGWDDGVVVADMSTGKGSN